MNQISPEQRAYVIAHINDRPRTEVAKTAGISISALYRIAKQVGADMQYNRCSRNPEWENIVRRYYPIMSGHEIERRFGITNNRANKIAADLGLKHSPETQERLYQKACQQLRDGKMNIDQEARIRKWKIRRRMDELRICEGKKPKHNFRFRTITLRAYRAIYHLVHQYGYHKHPEEPYTLLYDDHTQRRLTKRKNGTEQFYENKYHIKFKPKNNQSC